MTLFITVATPLIPFGRLGDFEARRIKAAVVIRP